MKVVVKDPDLLISSILRVYDTGCVSIYLIDLAGKAKRMQPDGWAFDDDEHTLLLGTAEVTFKGSGGCRCFATTSKYTLEVAIYKTHNIESGYYVYVSDHQPIAPATKLKLWNGRWRGHGVCGHASVCATSQTAAARLLSASVGGQTVSVHEIKNYFSNTWGNRIRGMVPTPCVGVWVELGNSSDVPPDLRNKIIQLVDESGNTTDDYKGFVATVKTHRDYLRHLDERYKLNA